MGSMNLVVLMGNLTRDPELRRTPAGLAVADIGLAVSEKYKSKTGEETESTCFVDIVAWGKQAETCAEHLAKGSAVVVEGRLQLDQWQTPAGEKRHKLKVRANRVQFVGRPRQGSGSTDSQEAQETVPAEVEAGMAF